jgi:hypothetical protein
MCGAIFKSSLRKPVTSVEIEADVKRLVDAMRRNDNGEHLPAGRFPDEFYWKQTDRKVETLSDFFSANGFWVVSGTVAEIMRGFDMGENGLYPTRFVQRDRVTPIAGSYFCLNFGARKASFRPDKSFGIRGPINHHQGYQPWRPPLPTKTDDLALDATALEGPEMWMETPTLINTFFLSGPLVAALKAAKLTRQMRLRRCRIVD